MAADMTQFERIVQDATDNPDWWRNKNFNSQLDKEVRRAKKRLRAAGGPNSLLLAMNKSEYARNVAHFLVQQKIVCKAGRTVLQEAGLRAFKVTCPRCGALQDSRCTIPESPCNQEIPIPHLQRFKVAFAKKPLLAKHDALDKRVSGSFESAQK